jgi:hypothetical protein
MIDIEHLKSRVSIVDIVENFVSLKRHGKDYFGCCPFHNEKTPSFTVNESEQFYHCFGCGESGDVVKFLQDINGWDFKQAAKYLGADIQETELTTGSPVKARPKSARLPLNQAAFSVDDITEFLRKCEVKIWQGERVYFNGASQIVILTDVNATPVSLVQLRGTCYKPLPYKKKFLYGSCAIFGQVDGDIYLCENWYTANRLHRVDGKNAICFFMPHNINFIYSAIKHKKVNMYAVCETDEAKFQAERLIVEM